MDKVHQNICRTFSQSGMPVSIEVRTYEGTAQELSNFVVQTWLESYQGKMIVPDWTPEYFDWQMTGPAFADEREYLLTAWDKGKLVGTMLGMPFPLWIHGQEMRGCQGSWLSVSQEYRRLGVASLMSSAMQARQKEQNCHARLGYAFQQSRISLGPRFWKRVESPQNHLKKVSLWTRVINPRIVSQWSNKRAEQLLLKYMPKMVCQIDQPHSSVKVREYEARDLAACRELINSQARQADLAILWTESRLQQHLQYGSLAHTLVVERDGVVVGFLNYHLLGLVLQRKILAGVIDLLAHTQLNGREIRALINSAVQKMQNQGVDLVLMREFGQQPFTELLRSRFVPQFSDSTLIMSPTEKTSAPQKKVQNVQLLWR